ncbi:MAG TPA: hypothetical protein VGK36_04165 [Candidatus Angelobacter sp.]
MASAAGTDTFLCGASVSCPAHDSPWAEHTSSYWVEQIMAPGFFPWVKTNFLLTSVTALNLPGLIIQLPYVITSPTKREWMPADVDFRVWRAITLPLLCLPFWWIAGRSIDALTALKHHQIAPRIRWPEVAIGSVWLAGGVTLFIGFLVSPPSDKDINFTLFCASGGLWAMLGALSVIARFRQWRFKKRQKAIS